MRGDLERLVKSAFSYVKGFAPVDTANLKNFAVKVEIAQDEAHLYVDERIAPYMKYTNEPWYNFAPPLFGKTNPNEGWFDRAVVGAFIYMAEKTGGSLT